MATSSFALTSIFGVSARKGSNVLLFRFHRGESLLQQCLQGGRGVFATVLVARSRLVLDDVILLGYTLAKAKLVNLEVLRLILDADADGGVVDCAVLDFNVGAAAFGRAAHAEGDFVVAKNAVLDLHQHVLFEVERRHVRDLTGLIPAVKIAVANQHDAPLPLGGRFRVDRIFAGTFPLLEAGGVGGQRAGPEGAIFDDDLTHRLAIRVELDRVAGDVADLAVANGEIVPVAGDAVGIELLLEGALQAVMDFAVFDDGILGEDADAVAAAVEDFAVAQSDVVGGDLDAITGAPFAVHEVVLVNARLLDLEAFDLLGILQAAHVALNPDRFCFMGENQWRRATKHRTQCNRKHSQKHGIAPRVVWTSGSLVRVVSIIHSCFRDKRGVCSYESAYFITPTEIVRSMRVTFPCRSLTATVNRPRSRVLIGVVNRSSCTPADDSLKRAARFSPGFTLSMAKSAVTLNVAIFKPV